ncbi:hypothetical protein [Inhella sp.]|uniref:hypothetical protein n=1 Tax=Inhella sp. TaxID=1921806 RepID=UPI0035AE4DB9
MAKVNWKPYDRTKDGPFFGVKAGVLTGWNSKEDLLSGKAFECERTSSPPTSGASGTDSSDPFEAWMKEQGIERPEGFEAQTALLARFLQSTASPEKAPSCAPSGAPPGKS